MVSQNKRSKFEKSQFPNSFRLETRLESSVKSSECRALVQFNSIEQKLKNVFNAERIIYPVFLGPQVGILLLKIKLQSSHYTLLYLRIVINSDKQQKNLLCKYTDFT